MTGETEPINDDDDHRREGRPAGRERAKIREDVKHAANFKRLLAVAGRRCGPSPSSNVRYTVRRSSFMRTERCKHFGAYAKKRKPKPRSKHSSPIRSVLLPFGRSRSTAWLIESLFFLLFLIVAVLYLVWRAGRARRAPCLLVYSQGPACFPRSHNLSETRIRLSGPSGC